jgi:hypothetical protein
MALALGQATFIQKFSSIVLKGTELTGDVGYYTLLALTCMPVLGQVGINQIAVGQADLAFLKAASVGAAYLLTVLLTPYLPLVLQGSWLFWLAGFGPWYFYDIVQMGLRSDFSKTGFTPIVDVGGGIVSSGGGKDTSGAGGAKWTLNATFLNVFFLTLGISGQAISAIFPSELGAQVGNGISYAGGGLLGVSMLGGLGVLLSSGGAGGAAGAAAAAATGIIVGGGSALPPLSNFIDKMQAPQTGGGKDDSMFLYGLGLVVFAGLTLGFIRSKQ